MPDRIETGTYAIAAAIAGGEVELVGARARNHRRAAVAAAQERRRGHRHTARPESAHATACGRMPCDVTTAPFPGFPTDLQAQFMALMAVADGTSLIRETIFENRFMHVPELARMGADIEIDGDTAMVRGVEKLKGAPVMATDLRASVSLVLAGLAAEGETMVNRVYHLDRGFERLEEKLSARRRRYRAGVRHDANDLKLAAEDAEDLEIMSARLQDAVAQAEGSRLAAEDSGASRRCSTASNGKTGGKTRACAPACISTAC